jgi:TATA-box binding protein (TBP) (component of TFIID and TFIIIB)
VDHRGIVDIIERRDMDVCHEEIGCDVVTCKQHHCGYGFNIEYNISNIVVKSSFNCNVNLKLISDVKRNFSGIVIKLNKCTALLFHNGNFVLVGAKSMKDITSDRKLLYNMLKSYNCKPKYSKLHVVNVCGYVSLPIKINLYNMALKLNAFYEPEIFPAIKYRNDNIMFTIHHTGKIFGTGFCNKKQMINCFKELINKILI